MGSGCPDGDYARFLEATLDLVDASEALPPRARFELDLAIVRVCESDRAARAALLTGEPRRLEQAATGLRLARARLADASREAAFEVRRRRTLLLVT